MAVLACPLDLEPLAAEGAAFRCPAGHSYDRARDGYVNLLPPGRPSRQRSGDDADSVHARRRFLDGGHYDALTDHIAAVVLELAPRTCLDVGCGEGHFTAALAEEGATSHGGSLPGTERRLLSPGSERDVVGVDLSRAGVRLAARRYRAITFSVANALALPVVSASVDLALSVFSPVVATEFARVVRAGGHALVVVPGAGHLAALRALLYEEPRPHDEDVPLSEDEGFALVSTERVSATATLRAATEVDDVLTMTPYRWAVPPEAHERARASAGLPFTTPVEFVAALYRRT